MVDESYWKRSGSRILIRKGRFSTLFAITFDEKRPPYPYKVAMKTFVSPNEAAIHRKVACMCENIVQYYDYKEECLYLELADRGDGENLLRSLAMYGKYSEKHLVKLLFQLLTAVATLHRNGWAHRDIKPANILFFSSKTAKLCDFGCSKRFFDPSDCNSVRGTPAYMSPALLEAHDALQSQTQSDPFQDDMYALGCTIFSFASLQSLSEFGIVSDEVGDQLLSNYIRSELAAYSSGFQDLVLAMIRREAGQRVTASAALESLGKLTISLPNPHLQSGCLNCGLQPVSVAFRCRHGFCQACVQTIASGTRRCLVCQQQI